MQWIFVMILAPIINGLVVLAINLTGHNTRKVNLVLCWTAGALFVASYVCATSSTPVSMGWIFVGWTLFWISWQRLEKVVASLEGHGQAVIPEPDFFSDYCATIKVLSCEQFWDSAWPQRDPDHETMESTCEVFENHYTYVLLVQMNGDYSTASALRLIQHHRPITPGYYKPAWQNGRWEFLSVRTPTTH